MISLIQENFNLEYPLVSNEGMTAKQHLVRARKNYNNTPYGGIVSGSLLLGTLGYDMGDYLKLFTNLPNSEMVGAGVGAGVGAIIGGLVGKNIINNTNTNKVVSDYNMAYNLKANETNNKYNRIKEYN